MEDIYSEFICQERDDGLMQKLMDATLELESMKNLKIELFNLLKIAYHERDEARCQLQNLIINNTFNFMPSSPIQNNEAFLMLPMAKPTSSITESKSFSHDSSPPLDSSFYDAPVSSSPVIDSNNNNNINIGNCYVNNNQMVQDQDLNYSKHDLADEVIEFLAKGKVLPQKGKLLQAVMDSCPLLQTMLLAGPLPCWRNPPPLQQINVPSHLNIKDYSGNSLLLKQEVVPSSSLLYSSNSVSKCSASMLNFDGNNTVSSWNNNALQFNSGSSVRIQVPSRKRQRHFL